MNNDEEGASNSGSGSKRKETSSHSKAARSGKSNKKLRSHLKKSLNWLQTTRLEWDMTKMALKARGKDQERRVEKANAVPADLGIDPKQVDTLRKQLRELQDEHAKLGAHAKCDDGNEESDWDELG